MTQIAPLMDAFEEAGKTPEATGCGSSTSVANPVTVRSSGPAAARSTRTREAAAASVFVEPRMHGNRVSSVSPLFI
jgi:hypothetical protein